MSSYCLFYPKSKYVRFTMIFIRGKQQIWAFWKLERAHFSAINNPDNVFMMKNCYSFSVHMLIVYWSKRISNLHICSLCIVISTGYPSGLWCLHNIFMNAPQSIKQDLIFVSFRLFQQGSGRNPADLERYWADPARHMGWGEAGSLQTGL